MGKTILIGGSVLPTTTNTPIREGEVVNSVADILKIKNPYVGQKVYVKDEKKYYFVKSLKTKIIGGIPVPDAAVNEYSDLITPEAMGQGIGEAPDDGQQYVRQSKTWKPLELATTTGEVCRINLQSNQGLNDLPSLNGAVVSVVDTETEQVYYNKAWDGTEIELNFSAGAIYKISVSDVNGYKTPEAKTLEAKQFSVRNVIMTYETCVVTVQMDSNQTDKSDIQRATALVTASNISTSVSSGESVKVPFGSNCTITWNAVANYLAPTTTFVANELNVIKTGVYKTEIVSVHVTTASSIVGERPSVEGQELTINGVVHTLTSTGRITQKVPFGSEYNVSVNEFAGYATPSVQTFTAELASRSVSVVYNEIPSGVFIEGMDLKLYREAAWDANTMTANSIVLLNSTKNLRIAIEGLGSMAMSNANDGWYEVSDEKAFDFKTQPSTALAHMDGLSATRDIAGMCSQATSYAAGLAYRKEAFTADENANHYIGTYGEWALVIANLQEINHCLDRCYGTQISGQHWTSTFGGEYSPENEEQFWVVNPSGYKPYHNKMNVRQFGDYNL